MNSKTLVLSLVLLGFGAFTAQVLLEYGGMGFLEAALATSPAIQVSIDLVIALSLFAIWMFQDARERGVSALPYLPLILCLGSIGALVYLLRREWAGATHPAAAVRS